MELTHLEMMTYISNLEKENKKLKKMCVELMEDRDGWVKAKIVGE